MRSLLKHGIALNSAFILGALKGEPKKEDHAPRENTHHRRAGYKQEEINLAYGHLMTGPKATPPRWKTVRGWIKRWRKANVVPVQPNA